MKTKSLQIGNYVLYKPKNVVVRVICVHDNLISFGAEEKPWFGTFSTAENFEPIKVDFDFLEKNGWHKLPHEEIKYYPGISVQFKNDDWSDAMRINYRESIHTYTILNDELRFSTVDEFQRILDVIGLPEEDRKIKF